MRKLAERIRGQIAQRKRSRRMTTTLTAIAGILVFLTVYTLILPALALEEEAYCGLKEHEHTDACYEQVLTCTKEEHVHTDACYDEDGNVICGKEEHTHSGKCYKETLTCGKERHVHTEACYEKPAPEKVTKASTQIQEEVVKAAKSANKKDSNKSSDGTTSQKKSDKATKDKKNTDPSESENTEDTEATTQQSKDAQKGFELSEHFTARTGLWYQETSSAQDGASDQSEEVWTKVDKKTTLDSDSLVRVHFAFQIPKDSLDGSSFESVYVLPDNLSITEETAEWLNDDINAVNQVITGTATPDKDSDKEEYLAGKYQLVQNEDEQWQLEIMWDPYVLVENTKSTLNVWTDLYLAGNALLPQKDGSYEIVFAKKTDDQDKVSVAFAGVKDAEKTDAADGKADATSETKDDKDNKDTKDKKDTEQGSDKGTEATSGDKKEADNKNKDDSTDTSKKDEKTSESKDSDSTTAKDSAKDGKSSDNSSNISDNAGNDSTSTGKNLKGQEEFEDDKITISDNKDKKVSKTYTYTLEGGTEISLKKLLVEMGIKSVLDVDLYVENYINDLEYSEEEIIFISKTSKDYNIEIPVKEGEDLRGEKTSFTILQTNGDRIQITIIISGKLEINAGNAVISAANDAYLPENAKGHAEVIDGKSAIKKVQKYTKAGKDASIEYSVFDIGLDNINTNEYKDGFDVQLEFPESISGRDFRLYHLHDGNVEELSIDIDTQAVNEDGLEEVSAIHFTTEGFSEFVLSYTVDFEYTDGDKVYAFSIPGGSSITVAEILTRIDVTENEKEANESIQKVEFTDESLVRVVTEDNQWILQSQKAFTTEEELRIYLKDGRLIILKVTDDAEKDVSQMLDNLSLTFNGRTITIDSEGNVSGLAENETLFIREGTTFDLNMLFKETSGDNNKQFAAEMVYPLPGGLDADGYDDTFDISFGEEGTITGNRIWVENGKIHIKLNTEDTNYPLINKVGNAQIKVHIHGKMNGNNLTFTGSVEKDINVDKDESHDTSVRKSARYENGKVYYTITASSTGTSENVKIKDTFTGGLVHLDQDSLQFTSSTGKTVEHDEGNTIGEKGFVTTIPKMVDGETITITYSATVSPMPENGIIKGSDGVLGNGVTIEADEDDPTPTPVVPTELNYDIDISSFGKQNKGMSNDSEIFTKEDGNEYRTVKWEITSNQERLISLAGSTIKDTINTNPDSRMSYSGEGITVYYNDGTGEKSRTLKWGDDGTDGKLVKEGNTWTYTIPNSDGNYSYRIEYTTDVKITGLVDSVKFNNKAEGKNGEGNSGADVGPRNEDRFTSNKTVEAVNGNEVTWKISTNVPKNGYDTFSIEELLPSKEIDGTTYYDNLVADSLKITDSKGKTYTQGNDFTVDTTETGKVKIVFTNGLPGNDTNYSLDVELKTTADADWVKKATIKDPNNLGNYMWHTNKAEVTANGTTKTPESGISLTSEGYDKSYEYVQNIDMKDGTNRKLYKFNILITGVNNNTNFPIVINDQFNTNAVEYLDPSKTLSSVGDWQGIVYGGDNKDNCYIYDGNYKAEAKATSTGATLLLSREQFVTKTMGNAENTYYPVYKLEYYLVTNADITDVALQNPNGKLSLTNQIDGDDAVTFNYEYPGITKEMTSLDTSKGLATFRIVINPDAARMNNGEPMRMIDEYLDTISINYESIQVSTDPAGMDVSFDAQSWDPRIEEEEQQKTDTNYLIFTVPDETKITITYTGHVTKTGNTHIKNTASLEDRFYSTVDQTRDIGGDTAGSGTVVKLRLMKYESGNMRNVLEGVPFALFTEENYNALSNSDGNGSTPKLQTVLDDLAKNGQDSSYVSHETSTINTSPVMKVFTTGSNGFVQVILDQEEDGTDLIIGNKYYLREITAPDGYELDTTPYEFTLVEGNNAEYTGYVYRNNDVLNVKNKPKAGLKLVKYVRDAELGSADKDKIIFKLYYDQNYNPESPENDNEANWQPYVPEGETTPVTFTYSEFVNNVKLVSDLPPGSYRVVEINEAIEGYNLVSTNIKIDDQPTTTISESEEKHLTIGSETSDTEKGSGAPIFADFKVLNADEEVGKVHTVTMTNKYDSSKIKLLKVDERGAYLAGATFVMTKDNTDTDHDGEDDVIATIVLDEANKNSGVTVSGLTEGDYTIVETVAPEGYVEITEPVKFHVDNEGKITYTTDSIQKQGYVAYDETSETFMVFTVTNEKEPEYTELKVQKKWVDLNNNDITSEVQDETVRLNIERQAYIDPIMIDVNVSGNNGSLTAKTVASEKSDVTIKLYNQYGFDDETSPATNVPVLTFKDTNGNALTPSSSTASNTPDPEDSRGRYFIYTFDDVDTDIYVTGNLNWDPAQYSVEIDSDAEPYSTDTTYRIADLTYGDNTGGTDHWSTLISDLPLTGSELVGDTRRNFGYTYTITEDGAIPLESSNNIEVINGTVKFTNQKKDTDIKLVKRWQDENGDDITDTYTGKTSVSGTLYQVEWTDVNPPEEYYTVSIHGGAYGDEGEIASGAVKAGSTIEVTMVSPQTFGDSSTVAAWSTDDSSANFNSFSTAVTDKEFSNENKTLTYRYTVTGNVAICATTTNGAYNSTVTTVTWPSSTAKPGTPYTDDNITQGKVVIGKTEAGEDSWSKTIKDLPLYEEKDGSLVYYTYYFIEDGQDKFVTSYSPSVTEEGRSRGVTDGTITVTNKKDTTSIQVEKLWQDKAGNNYDPPNIDEVPFHVYQIASTSPDGSLDNTKYAHADVKIWKYSATDNDLMKMESDIVPINTSDPSTATITMTLSKSANPDLRVYARGTSYYSNSAVKTTYTKREEITDTDGRERYVYTWVIPVTSDTEIGCCVNQVNNPKSIVVDIEWSKSVRTRLPETYKVVRNQDTGNWEITNVDDLDKTGIQEIDGVPTKVYYTYVIQEDDIPGYIGTYSNNDGIQKGRITITNKRENEETSIEVDKKWFVEDENNPGQYIEDESMDDAAGSISFDIYRKASVVKEGDVWESVKDKTLYKDFNIEFKANNNSFYQAGASDFSSVRVGDTFKIVLKYNGTNTELPKIRIKSDTDYPIDIAPNEVSDSEEWRVFTYYVPVTQDMTQQKYRISSDNGGWNSFSQYFPGDWEVVSVTATSGTGVGEKVGSYSINADDNWSAVINGLDAEGINSDGMKVTYTYYVEETDINVKGAYNPSYENNDGISGAVGNNTISEGDVITINNNEVHEDTVNLNVEKKWFDQADKDITNSKTGSVQFKLIQKEVVTGGGSADGNVNMVLEVRDNNGAYYNNEKIINVPASKAIEIILTPPEHYSASIDDIDSDVTLTMWKDGPSNTSWFDGNIEVTARKEIQDDGTIKVTIPLSSVANCETKAAKIYVHLRNQNYDGWENGHKNHNSFSWRVKYSTEDYGSSDNDDSSSGIQYNDETRQADTTKFYTLSSDTDPAWSYSFTKLPKNGTNDDGDAVTYEYTVEEVRGTGYDSAVSEVAFDESTQTYSVEIDNTLTQPSTVDIGAKKKWTVPWPEDTQVQVTLKSGGTIVNPPDESQQNPHWLTNTDVYTWTGLPEFVEGTTNQIEYTVEETAIKVGETVYTGADIAKYWSSQSVTENGVTTITNTPNKGNLTVEKKIKLNGTEVNDNEVLNNQDIYFTIQPENDSSKYVANETTGTFSSQKISFTIQPGSSNKKTFTNLPVGNYIVTEELENGTVVGTYRFKADGSTQTSTVEVLKDTPGEAILENNYEENLGSLKITKKVTVNGAEVTDSNKTAVDGTYYFSVTKTGQDETLFFIEDEGVYKACDEGTENAINSLPITINDGVAKTIEVKDLEPGSYTISEDTTSHASSGISPDHSTVIVKVEAGKTGGDVPSTAIGIITNNKEVSDSFELPHTGGSGTKLLYTLGSILVLLSGALLLIRRRRLTPVRVTDSSLAAHKTNTTSRGGGRPV